MIAPSNYGASAVDWLWINVSKKAVGADSHTRQKKGFCHPREYFYCKAKDRMIEWLVAG